MMIEILLDLRLQKTSRNQKYLRGRLILVWNALLYRVRVALGLGLGFVGQRGVSEGMGCVRVRDRGSGF